jgi:hypothetical protein
MKIKFYFWKFSLLLTKTRETSLGLKNFRKDFVELDKTLNLEK